MSVPVSASASRPRLVSKTFLAVMSATGAFFVYVGMLVPILPPFIEDELGGGELGVGLSLAAFAFAAIVARPILGRLVERFGRRRVMIGGALLAGTAGFLCALVNSLPPLLALRAVAGVGEAALFVGAATLITDLAPRDRRAEAASYFSVAVFGGLGVGPVIGEAVLSGDRFHLAFLVAGGFTVLAAVLSLAVPHRIELADGEQEAIEELGGLPGATGIRRWVHPAAIGPGVVLASSIAALSVFSAFLPEHARSVGFAGSGALFAVYSVVCLVLRLAGARLPERLGPRRAVTLSFASTATALFLLAAFAQPWALWVAAAVIGVGTAFIYPSLMALAIDRAPDSQRPRVLGSFTMFFELGTVTGGVALGLVAQMFGKRAAFGGAVVICLAGLWLLRSRVVPADDRLAITRPAPAFVPATD
ncbi:MAG: MFS transporter [Ilumatobacteraceae bacterium]